MIHPDPDQRHERTQKEESIRKPRFIISQKASKRLSILGETRTQILLWYIGLMAVFVGISVPTIYNLLYQKVDQRGRAEIAEEIEDFVETLKESPPSNLISLEQFFEDHLNQKLVEDDIFLIAIQQGKFLKSSPRALPAPMQPGSKLLEGWVTAQVPVQGELETTDPSVETILFTVQPVMVEGVVQGALVVAHTTAGERKEISEAAHTVLRVMLAVMTLAALLAWWISSWILNPLRQLITTVRQISESNLTQRIPTQGNGELSMIGSAFNSMLDRLQFAFTQQQNFINDASHELRTPITIIQGHLDLIGSVAPDQQEVLELVQDELGRMNRFVNDLLVLAHAGKPDFYQPDWVELDELMEELHSKAKVLTGCHLTIDRKKMGKAYLDRQRITQSIMNLVENATQHTPPDGRITIGADISREHVCFWVNDTGRGIHKEDQTRIFDRFARSKANPRPSQGAGLGLSIVKAIMDSAKGRVELYSIPKKGSTFFLIFPRVQYSASNHRTVS